MRMWPQHCLKFDNGAIGTVTLSDSIVAPWSWEFTSREYPIYPYLEQSCYQIGGSHGALSVPDLNLWAHKKKRDWWTDMTAETIACDVSDPLILQIRHFVEVIHGKTTAFVSGREGLRTLAVIDAIQIAAKSGKIIPLDVMSGSKKLAKPCVTT